VLNSEKLFIGGDLNGHVGTARSGFERVYGDFDIKNKPRGRKKFELHYSL
jgi:hypothetical protein